jgi:hypothetical protein
VRCGVVRVPEPLHQAPEHVADPHHPEQVTTLHDGKMANLLVAHQPGGVEDRVGGVDGERVPGHHVADLDDVEVAAVPRQGEDVTLGEDANERPGLADRDGPNAFLEHAQDGQANRVVSVDRHYSRPHDVADRHASIVTKCYAGASAPGV